MKERPLKILHVLHNWNYSSGVELRTAELAKGLRHSFQSSVIYPKLYTYGERDNAVLINRTSYLDVYEMRLNFWRMTDYLGIFSTNTSDQMLERRFFNFLKSGSFDLVHFHHLAGWGSLQLPILAKHLKTKVILSFYDYFLNCPNYNLLLPDGLMCQKTKIRSNDPTCLNCLASQWFRFGSEELPAISFIENYIKKRNEIVQKMLSEINTITVCSKFTKHLIEQAFGEKVKSKIEIIPRGVRALPKSARPQRNTDLRVGFVGNFTVKKGGDVFIRAAQKLSEKPVSFKVFGDIENRSLKSRAIRAGISLMGPYDPADLPRLLENIDVAVILSTWNETYCTVLSELQKMQVPVIATHVGALGERIFHGKTGFLIPPNDSEILAACLLRLAMDIKSLEPIHRELKKQQVFELHQAIEAHRRLYHNVLSKKSKVFEPHHRLEVSKRKEASL